MRLVCISDTHRFTPQIERLPWGDTLIFSGDEDIRELKDLVRFLNWFSSFDYKYKIWISGNHDLYCENNTGIVKMYSEEVGVIYLENEEVSLPDLTGEQIRFYGSPITPMFNNWAFMRERGDEITEVWKKIPKGIDVLITHGPAMSYLDVSGRGEICLGCYDLKRFIKKIKPQYHIFGHIHGSYGTMKDGDTTFVNCSLVNEHYDLRNEPIVVEVEGG